MPNVMLCGQCNRVAREGRFLCDHCQEAHDEAVHAVARPIIQTIAGRLADQLREQRANQPRVTHAQAVEQARRINDERRATR